MWYRLLLQQFKREYPVSRKLTNLLKFALKSGVRNVTREGRVHITIEFNNGWTLQFPDIVRYRYNAWVSTGFLSNKRGIFHEWSKEMPSAKVVYQIKRLLDL